MSTMRKIPSEHPGTEGAASSLHDVKTPLKTLNSNNVSNFSFSPATPLVPHTPSTPAAAPSSSSRSSSTSTLQGTSSAGTPSTPYRWNLGPVASSSKSAGRVLTGMICVSPLSPSPSPFQCTFMIDYTVGASTSECGFNMQEATRTLTTELPTLTILAIDEVCISLDSCLYVRFCNCMLMCLHISVCSSFHWCHRPCPKQLLCKPRELKYFIFEEYSVKLHGAPRSTLTNFKHFFSVFRIF